MRSRMKIPLRAVCLEDEPDVEWAILEVNEPGSIRICLPSEEEASRLVRECPDGRLARINDQLIWAEPLRITPVVS